MNVMDRPAFARIERMFGHGREFRYSAGKRLRGTPWTAGMISPTGSVRYSI